jgi:hypothetical protein
MEQDARFIFLQPAGVKRKFAKSENISGERSSRPADGAGGLEVDGQFAAGRRHRACGCESRAIAECVTAAGRTATMNLKLSAIALLAVMIPAQARSATLTDAEAAFLDQLVTAATVLGQRCTGYEVNGAGGVQQGARLLGNPNAAMAMIAAYDAAIKAHDGQDYDPSKFRPEVFDAASKTSKRVLAALMKNPEAACADYGGTSVAYGLLRRY